MKLPITALITFLCSTEAKVTSDFEIGSFFSAKPIRMEELDGAMIVRFSEGKESFVPLLYPARQTLFQWIDEGDVNLITYEQYRINPGLFVKPSPFVGKSPFVTSPKLESGEKNKPATSSTPSSLSPKSPVGPLPSLSPLRTSALPGDRELQAFMLRNRDEEKVASMERQPLEVRDGVPLPPVPGVPPEKAVPSLSQVFADPNLNKEYQRLVNSSTLGKINAKREKEYAPETAVEIEAVPANLKLKASKRTKDGRVQPAQASEFYLTTQNLHELFKDMNVERALSGEIKSVAEIWAHAEKNLNTNPEVALGVKSILLQAKVGRARTNPFGEASLSDLPPDEKYFIIGIDKDENTNVVTIWSKEVEVNPGDNLVELSSRDVIYQD